MSVLRILLGGLFVLAGVVQLAWCTVVSSQALMAIRWPTTPGTIQSSKVVTVEGGRSVGHMPTVSYTYQVSGVSYEGHRIYMLDSSEFPAQARNTVAEFPVGSTVAVHFNTRDPALALLRPGLYWYSFVWLGLSCTGILVGAFMVRTSLRKKEALGAA